MATTPTPPASASPADGPAALAAQKATAAPRGAEAAGPPGTSSPARRRRVPRLAVGLAGALIAGAYAHVALGMRLGPPLVMTGLGGLTLVLTAFALWRVVDPLTRDEVRATAGKRAPARLHERELEREKQAVLKAIKEIELDYQMKKIGETDYREMVERYRARALRVMGELAAGDDYRALIERELKDRLAVIRATAVATATAHAPSGAATAPAPAASEPTEKTVAAGACGACAVVNDPDARFCKSCGVALGAAPASASGGLSE